MWVLFLFLLWPSLTWAQAPTASSLTTGGDTSCTDASAPVTASITPIADRLTLLSLTIRSGTGPPPTAVPTGNGLAWVEVVTRVSGSNLSRTTLWRALGASPTTGTIAFDLNLLAGDGIVCAWTVSQYAGADTSGTDGSGAIVQTASNATGGTALTVNLTNAFSDINNVAYGVFGSSGNVDLVPGVSPNVFTQIGVQATGSVGRNMAETGGAWTAVNVTVTGAVALTGIAAEIKSATPGGPVTGGRRRMAPRHESSLIDYFLTYLWVPLRGGYVAG